MREVTGSVEDRDVLMVGGEGVTGNSLLVMQVRRHVARSHLAAASSISDVHGGGLTHNMITVSADHGLHCRIMGLSHHS